MIGPGRGSYNKLEPECLQQKNVNICRTRRMGERIEQRWCMVLVDTLKHGPHTTTSPRSRKKVIEPGDGENRINGPFHPLV